MFASSLPRKTSDESGLTGLELLVVLLIVGILAAICLPVILAPGPMHHSAKRHHPLFSQRYGAVQARHFRSAHWGFEVTFPVPKHQIKAWDWQSWMAGGFEGYPPFRVGDFQSFMAWNRLAHRPVLCSGLQGCGNNHDNYDVRVVHRAHDDLSTDCSNNPSTKQWSLRLQGFAARYERCVLLDYRGRQVVETTDEITVQRGDYAYSVTAEGQAHRALFARKFLGSFHFLPLHK